MTVHIVEIVNAYNQQRIDYPVYVKNAYRLILFPPKKKNTEGKKNYLKGRNPSQISFWKSSYHQRTANEHHNNIPVHAHQIVQKNSNITSFC